ncbi:MAG: ribbon-helix-helix domain-containing protein [Promethearchaeota archaeon]
MKAIDKLVTKKEHTGRYPGIYPSRSELIRVAVREFLVKELEAAEAFEQLAKSPKKDALREFSVKEVKQTTVFKKISL